jgi:cell division transport system permease protein
MRVRGPFVVEGVIYGIVATLLSTAIFWPITAWFGNNMSNFLGLNLYDYYLSNFFQIFVIILLSGIVLGVISSLLAIRRYLNR